MLVNIIIIKTNICFFLETLQFTMLKRFIPFSVFTFFAFAVLAQRPTFVPVDMRVIPNALRAACDNKAGTSTQTLTVSSQSNDKKYLCYKDKLTIKHNKDQVLISDPNPATLPGVGYLYLTCNPTVAGTTIQQVAADPCILKTSSGGTPPGDGVYLETGGVRTGDNEFFNDGYWQTTYGAGKPFKLIFAPITFDAFDGLKKPVYESAPNDACVNVNTAASFEVIYLNEIKQTILTQGNQSGSFSVNGGVSEYDNTSNYTVDIALKSNPSIKATITSGAVKHGGTVNFTTTQNGIYTVSIEDGKSCGATFDMVMSAAVDVLVQNDTICTAGQGKLTIFPSGGVAPYTYTYQQKTPVLGAINGPFSYDFTKGVIPNQAVGTYEIIVKDATGATSAGAIGTIKIATQPGLTVTGNAPNCSYGFDGSATANLVGGSGPFYYEWNNGEKGSNKQNITGLGVGNIGVTVTDRFGCTTSASGALSKTPIEIGNINSNAATCIGAKDGQINFTVTGGEPLGGNYDFKWQLSKNPSDTLLITSSAANFWGRSAGTYFVTITDNLNCKLIKEIEIEAQRTLEIKHTVDDAKCFNQANGSLTVQVTPKGLNANDNSTMNFIWSPNPGVSTPIGTSFSEAYNNVIAGLYIVTVLDKFGCIISDSIEVKQPLSALSAIATKIDPTCAGNSANGSISITSSGGTPSYGYAWANSTSISPTRINLVAGNYTVTVTDANSCSTTLTTTLIAPIGPKIDSIKIQNVNCFTDKIGSINVFATTSNPAGGLTYKWSNGATTSQIFNLAPGKYSVTVIDANNCASFADTAILSPPALVLVGLPAITKPSCPNSADGSIEIEVEGGTPNYTYQWASQNSNGSKDDEDNKYIITGLTVGVYSITITDKNNCPSLIIPLVNIAVPATIALTKTVDKAVSCAVGTCDGEATITITSGNSATGLYNVSWANNPAGLAATLNEPLKIPGLCAGWNKITISDFGPCTHIDSIFIDAPPAVGFDSTTLKVTPVTCFDGSDGSIMLNAKGGEGPYTYSWVQGLASSGTVTNLKADDYILTIKDNKNCEFRTTITVAEPEELIAIVDTAKTDSVSCTGAGDGKITLKVSGGNPQYAFAWDNNISFSSVADKLFAGSYGATVTDSKGCSVTIIPHVVGEQPPITFTLDTIAIPICNGYLTDVRIKSASGGHGSTLANYRFTIDDGAPVNAKDGVIPIGGGEHTVRVFDPNGCFNSLTIKIDEPPILNVYLGQDLELELGEIGELNATIQPAGIPIVKYNWSWSPNATPLTFSDSCKNTCAQIIKPFVDGSYILQVESIDGCLGADTVNITIDKNRNVFIPNIFSPNVDGTNDFFEVFADPQGVEQINYLRVYDRWGNLVFDTPAPFTPANSRVVDNRWNGYFKDIEANVGVYIYACEVKFVDGVTLVFRGDIMLAR